MKIPIAPRGRVSFTKKGIFNVCSTPPQKDDVTTTQSPQAAGYHKQMMKRRRGITPLISVILFLSFAVAVASVVMNLGRAQVEESAQCSLEVGLRWVEIGGKQQACFDGKTISFVVENGINANIEGLLVNVIGGSKAETVELKDAQMPRAGTYVGKVAFDSAVSGEIRQVKISPQILLKGEEEICPDQALVMENIAKC